ncbi:Carboxypeptidase G2 [Methylobacterium crusticola]|uniref:Carboxypeptidase G2 n=1 Tax=Methylobacterium crusticola TaxID=1697972 RepID=A0ABQ4R5V0_9HYPH|nr:M20 family metallopeptidase [Methylobacterium crusticola]GJD53028.1 Carboxypeptidase G2 [Methylobacterium crusticola]
MMHPAAEWLATRHDAMVALLGTLVNRDSGSYDKPGVDAVGTALAEFLAGAGIACTRIPVAPQGDVFRAALPERGAGGAEGGRPVLLLGHRDTVFPRGEAARRPFSVRDGRAYGPGVADMKAGLVLHAFVLAAFAAAGGAPLPLVGLFTGDEEIGSPGASPIIAEEARAARCVLNAEPGRVSGNVVTGRRGGIFFRCTLAGRAAHAGLNFEDGRSAILALARKIDRWMSLPESEPGTTVNVGLISGGQSVNTVAPDAACEIDLRYADPGARDHLVARIRAIAAETSVPGTSAEVAILGEFYPMVQSPGAKALFEAYVEAARVVGFPVGGEFTRSCADSGLTAAVGTPTLCGVGPVGGGAHSPEEYLELATLVPRAQALAQTIAGLAAGG